MRCARLGARGEESVNAALTAHGVVGRLRNHQARLVRLCRVERVHQLSNLLYSIREAPWLPEEGEGPHSPADPCDHARERRFAQAMHLLILTWVDGSPMLNRSWQAAFNHVAYSHSMFVHGTAAELACRRPMLHFLQQGGDSLKDMQYTGGVRLKDFHTLNAPLAQPGGKAIWAKLRGREGDTPCLCRRDGVCSGSTGTQCCVVCTSFREDALKLRQAGNAPLRTLPEAAALAKKAARIPVYSTKFGSDIGSAAELAQLIRELGGTPASTRKANALIHRLLTNGYVAGPAEFGTNYDALSEVKALLPHGEALVDWALHNLKGFSTYVFGAISESLTPARRAILEERLDELHGGGATVKSGMHRRLELASAPALLEGLELGELQEAVECLALAMMSAYRVPYSTWRAHRHHHVLRTAAYMFKLAILLKRNVPTTKKTKKGQTLRPLFGIFFHQAVSHLTSFLKLWCPMHTMTEWFEMMWGPMRRLLLTVTNRKSESATLQLIIRMQMQALFQRLHGMRAQYSGAGHSDGGAVRKAFEKYFGETSRERVVLDERFLDDTEFPAFLQTIAPYLVMGPGVWYHAADTTGGGDLAGAARWGHGH